MKKLILLLFIFLSTSCASDWRTASRESAGIAPKAEDVKEAMVQVYVARTMNWRGWFAVHPWISWKEENATQYTVAHVIGWRARRGLSTVVVEKDIPDRYWFGSKPEIVYEIRGDKATRAINHLKEIIPKYPYAHQYRVYPGPNSNTFVAHLIRETPELEGELPPHAIGKDWLVDDYFFAPTASATGYQFSFFGVFGLSMGLQEGIEVNLLGLNFGLDFYHPAIKLPMIGRVGFPESSTANAAE